MHIGAAFRKVQRSGGGSLQVHDAEALSSALREPEPVTGGGSTTAAASTGQDSGVTLPGAVPGQHAAGEPRRMLSGGNARKADDTFFGGLRS